MQFFHVETRLIFGYQIFIIFLEPNAQYKSFSLTGPGAAQLSQSVKERFGTGTNSLPKSSLDMHVFHARLVSFVIFKTYTKLLKKSILNFMK